MVLVVALGVGSGCWGVLSAQRSRGSGRAPGALVQQVKHFTAGGQGTRSA